MTISAETPDDPRSDNATSSQTLKTLRKMQSRPTQHVDQLGAALRDRLAELDTLDGRIVGDDADAIRTALSELTLLEAALLAAATTFAFQSVCLSVVSLQTSQLEIEQDLVE